MTVQPAGLFALGAWLGCNLTGGVGIAAFAALIGMRFAARRSVPLTIGLPGAFGLLIELAVAPTIAYYGSMDPRALWQAGGATALYFALGLLAGRLALDADQQLLIEHRKDACEHRDSGDVLAAFQLGDERMRGASPSGDLLLG